MELEPNAPKDEIFINENRIVIRAYSVHPSTLAAFRQYVHSAMQEVGKPDLAFAIEIIAKELITNAARANFKKIFFAENQLRLDDPHDYEIGVARFRETFSEEMFDSYGRKAQSAQFLVLITFDYDSDRAILEVRNNVPMTHIEERRAREKLRLAMSSDDMEQFILENSDEEEGAGLGIMLCLTVLRSCKIDPRVFSISTDFRTHTLARVEFPLHEGYLTTRQRYQLQLQQKQNSSIPGDTGGGK
ncbi:MAG: hypothetical protein N2Z22_05685 [Turneriella sp.]|nr:hypothetical protein [Turneriella sp.]